MTKFQLSSLLLLSALLFWSASKPKVPYDRYIGGRFGFSGVTLNLYKDSTYTFREWNHTGYTCEDEGNWIETSGHFYLNSSSKRKRKPRFSRTKPYIRFFQQEFTIEGDTLKLIPEDTSHINYYDLYYTLYKVRENK